MVGHIHEDVDDILKKDTISILICISRCEHIYDKKSDLYPFTIMEGAKNTDLRHALAFTIIWSFFGSFNGFVRSWSTAIDDR